MPKFRNGSPQITFAKKGGKPYTKTYHSQKSASKAVVAMTKAGAIVLKIGKYKKR